MDAVRVETMEVVQPSTRAELVEAVAFAEERRYRALQAWVDGGRTLVLWHDKMVADREVRDLRNELRMYDDARSVAAVYRMDLRGGGRR